MIVSLRSIVVILTVCWLRCIIRRTKLRQGGLDDTFEARYPRIEILLRFAWSIRLAQVGYLARYALLEVSKAWMRVKGDRRIHENMVFPDCTVLRKVIKDDKGD